MIKNHLIYNGFLDWRFTVSKAEGSYLWDEQGRKYLDFTSGWNVANLGWNNPEISQVLHEQADTATYTPMWTNHRLQANFADALTQALPSDLCCIARATGGTEANEEAIKTARAFTGRKNIIGFIDSYHGQSYGTLALGYLPNYTTPQAIAPMPSGFIQLPYPCAVGEEIKDKEMLARFADELERVLQKEDCAALVTEAGIITGWGSVQVAPKGFLQMVRKLTQKYGTLLILDEVGTGYSRCGYLFGMQEEEITPDIITFAKGITNGIVPLGAMVTTEAIAESTWAKTNLTSTFGWTPLACAVASKVLEIHLRDKMWEQAGTNGEWLMKRLKESFCKQPHISHIRGKGMEIGVQFSEKGIAQQVVDKAWENGLHILSDKSRTIQIMPPLTIKQEVLQNGVDILVKCIHETNKG